MTCTGWNASMQVLDASSALHAWDNYPHEQLPGLWKWLAQQIAIGELTIAAVALEEVAHKSPECAAWFKAQRITVLQVSEDILMDALRIKKLLGIEGESYGSGVGENDLIIVATARAHAVELLTEEARQPSLHKSWRNYKIPAVCNLPEVKVSCLNFVEYLKRAGTVFG